MSKTELTQGTGGKCKGCMYKASNPSIDNCKKRYSKDAGNTCLTTANGIFKEVKK